MKLSISLSLLALTIASTTSLAVELKEIRVSKDFVTEEITGSIDAHTLDALRAGVRNEQVKAKAIEVAQNRPSPAELEAEMIAMMFPVSTASMKLKKGAGNLERELKIPINLAVIGSDAYSVAWLKSNKDELVRLKASVMLVECETFKEYQLIKAVAPELDLIPLSGFPLAQEFNLSYYPALLTSSGVYQ